MPCHTMSKKSEPVATQDLDIMPWTVLHILHQTHEQNTMPCDQALACKHTFSTGFHRHTATWPAQAVTTQLPDNDNLT